MSLELKTIAMRDDGCFSVLLWEGVPFAVSVERTFEDGRPVIQNGIYPCQRSFFNHGGYETFEIVVEGHSRVLFHKGNRELDSLACICVAEKFGVLQGETAVLESQEGFTELMNLTKDLSQFNMTVSGR